jgi:hypothetical protein
VPPVLPQSLKLHGVFDSGPLAGKLEITETLAIAKD